MNIFDGFDKESKRNLSSVHIKTVTYNKGDIIFKQGDLCNKLAYVINGSVDAKTTYDNDSSTTIRVIAANSYIGINLIFSSNPIYKADFICNEKTTIELISKDELLKLLKNSDVVLNNFLTILSNIAINQNDYLKMVNVKTLKGKVCYFLYQEYRKYNSLEFDIKYTKTEIAKILKVERPSLGYEIKNLCDENVIENKNKHYKILSLEMLLKYMEK